MLECRNFRESMREKAPPKNFDLVLSNLDIGDNYLCPLMVAITRMTYTFDLGFQPWPLTLTLTLFTLVDCKT